MDLQYHGAAHEPSAAADGLMTAGDWSSGLLAPGQSYKRRFDRPGVYIIFDETNPANSVTIIVEGGLVFLPLLVK